MMKGVPPHPERIPRTVKPRDPNAQKKKGISAGAWEEARALIWTHRRGWRSACS